MIRRNFFIKIFANPEVAPAPVKPFTPIKVPSTPINPHKSPVETPVKTPFDPFKPPQPKVTPQPKAKEEEDDFVELQKVAGYDEKVHPNVKKFWQDIPEDHPYKHHPIFSEYGDILSRESYDYTSEVADTKSAPSLAEIQEIEAAHKSELEQLAINITTELFGIDASMLRPKLQQPSTQSDDPDNFLNIQQKLEQEDLSSFDFSELDKFKKIDEIKDQVGKRISLNALTQGAAVHAMYTIHHLINDALNSISPKLLDLYSGFAAHSHKAFWLQDFYSMIEGLEGSIGQESIKFEANGPVVVAEAAIFPVLVQELIKGVMELLTMHGLSDFSAKELENIYSYSDRNKDEAWLIQIGPVLWRKFLKVLPEGPEFSIPNIIALLSKESPEVVEKVIHGVVQNPESATELIRNIVNPSKTGNLSYQEQLLLKEALRKTAIPANEAYEKYYDPKNPIVKEKGRGVPLQVFNSIVRMDPTGTPENLGFGAKKFLDMYIDGGYNPEDWKDAKYYLELILNYKNKLNLKEVQQSKTFDELRAVLEPIYQEDQKKRKKVEGKEKEIQDGLDDIKELYRSDKWALYEIPSFQASRVWGGDSALFGKDGSSWCTRNSKNLFSQYAGSIGKLYGIVFLPETADEFYQGTRWQFDFSSYEFRNVKDNTDTIGFISKLNEYPDPEFVKHVKKFLIALPQYKDIDKWLTAEEYKDIKKYTDEDVIHGYSLSPQGAIPVQEDQIGSIYDSLSKEFFK